MCYKISYASDNVIFFFPDLCMWWAGHNIAHHQFPSFNHGLFQTVPAMGCAVKWMASTYFPSSIVIVLPVLSAAPADRIGQNKYVVHCFRNESKGEGRVEEKAFGCPWHTVLRDEGIIGGVLCVLLCSNYNAMSLHISKDSHHFQPLQWF